MITPYRTQVQKIRNKLKKEEYQDVMVGSTEEFQGQERRVTFVATVRSSPEYVTTDSQYKLGFLANPKTFNVSITRAKSLLIIVGNPHILSQDVPREECEDVSSDVCRDVAGDKCREVPREECNQVPWDATIVQEDVCTSTDVEVCNPVPCEVCDDQDRRYIHR